MQSVMSHKHKSDLQRTGETNVITATLATMQQRDSPAISLIRELLVALLAIVLTSTGWVEQVLPSDEVDPGTHLQQQYKPLAFLIDSLT